MVDPHLRHISLTCGSAHNEHLLSSFTLLRGFPNRNRISRRDPGGGALIVKEFDLHLYHSSDPDEGWVTQRLAVEEPVRDALVPLPRAVADSMLYHETGKTVTVGGERGTVAWVDLWRGVILCDVLDERPALRDVPLPLPARGNWDRLLQECNYATPAISGTSPSAGTRLHQVRRDGNPAIESGEDHP
jgi:hypothetical protein